MYTNNEQLQMDQISRNRIVTDIDSNFFVEAGAGSGKTTMLVNRMVAMVEQGRDISRICAITFTKAAANEFRGRFQKLLLERSNPESVYVDRGYAGQLPPPTEETRERCAYALRNLDLCFMGTIDAFCQMLIAEHPYETGVPSDAAVVPDADLDILYKQEYIRICEGAYGEELADLAAGFHALNQSPESVFVKGMRKFMENKNSVISFTEERGYVPNTLDVTYHAQIEEIRQLCPDEFTFKGAWERKLSIVLGKLNQLKKEYEKDEEKYRAQLTPQEWQQKEAKYVKTSAIYHTLQDLQYNSSMTFLAAAAPKIAEYLRENGVMTYFDYLYYLRNMLRENARQGGALIQYIFRRHSYYLIDEFQDTNPIQSEIFFYLTAEHPVEKWQNCDPKPGTLFIVGDPKQSIYRFRNADVGSYLRVKELFAVMPQGDILQLTQNFRSRNKLCQFFNEVFEEEFQESTYQCGFTPIPIVKQEQPEFEGVYSYTCSNPKYKGKIADQYQVAKIIKTLVGNPAFKIRDADGTGVRTIRYRDIMVIHKAKTNMGWMLAEFERQEIPVRVEGKVRFNECKALRKVFAEYKLRANIEDCPPAALFYRIMEETPVYDEVEADGMEILYYVLELLRKAEKDRRIVTPQDGVTYIETMMSKDAEEERCLSLTEDADCVHMANLHKVKGLEAPVVILAYAHPPLKNNPDIHTAYDADESKTYLFRLEKDSKYPWDYYEKVASFSTDVYEEYYKQEKVALTAELTRLIYVAATRARNVLIVSKILINKATGAEYRSVWKPLLNNVNDFFYMADRYDANYTLAAKDRPKTQAADLYKRAKETCVLNDRTAETAGYEIVTPSRLELDTDIPVEDVLDLPERNTELEAAEDICANSSDGITREERGYLLSRANILGTMLHRLMEILVNSRNKIPIDDMTIQILEECLPPEEAEKKDIFARAIAMTAETIRNGGCAQKNDAPQDILHTLLAADEVYTEVPFCYSEKQGDQTLVYNGIMDVVYCEEGNWHIIDYKTNYDGEHLDKKYKAQLDAYIKALKQTTGHDADAKIYHIEL